MPRSGDEGRGHNTVFIHGTIVPLSALFFKNTRIATHAWLNDHSIDFKSAHVIDKGSFRVRKTLESWHMAITSDADNKMRNK